MIKLILNSTLFLFLTFISASAEMPTITMASTTSTDNSGFFDYILPKFTKIKNISIRIISQGTGQAIKTAENGNVDVLLVHHTTSEEEFVKNGFGVKRYDLMFNDFVIIGPKSDPAKINNLSSNEALKKLAKGLAPFISRGDDSGTNKKELELWKNSNITNFPLDWYIQSGSGMGATLNMTIAKNGYTLTDRATWLAFKNKSDHKILVEGEDTLHNQYGIIVVNKEKYPDIKTKEANIFVNWMLSAEGQKEINNFKINGRQVYFANPSKYLD